MVVGMVVVVVVVSIEPYEVPYGAELAELMSKHATKAKSIILLFFQFVSFKLKLFNLSSSSF